MDIKNHEIKEYVKPRKLIFRNEIYDIIKLPMKFDIAGYVVKTVNGKIDMVILNNPHPNAIPSTGEFCIPQNLRKYELTSNSKNMITSMLLCFNLDDCYFTPWDEIEYKKQEVTGTWKKKD
jgi:hypothetical protein